MHFNKPLIGITLGQALKVKYRRQPMSSEYDYLCKHYHYAIEKSGGLPVGLFNTNDDSTIEDYLDSVDGLVFTGGFDMSAKYFNHRPHHRSSKPRDTRDKFEFTLLTNALKRKIPVFCICRGHQILNVVMGGSLCQDISLKGPGMLCHTKGGAANNVNHKLNLSEDSLLYKIIGRREINCNSGHHQVIDKPGKGLTVSAMAPDGIIEGLEINGYPFLLSVQWHPEQIFKRAHSRQLFNAFVSACLHGT
ncbi:MAG: gamma-glutamyl-gamma-aminobutyrate hydrolase family protein [candidate division Zixibacteria bacterium]|nr:gamma-glutamyl-gamma-aminobutyrate hydrolase family protein [candidate division Zixibacteria bacterium]